MHASHDKILGFTEETEMPNTKNEKAKAPSDPKRPNPERSQEGIGPNTGEQAPNTARPPGDWQEANTSSSRVGGETDQQVEIPHG